MWRLIMSRISTVRVLKSKNIPATVTIVGLLAVLGSMALAAQDRFTLKASNGVGPKKKNPESPYFVMVPDTLKSVSFIEKDSKRFPETSGWGYAQFLYDAASDTFTPYGSDSSFGKQVVTRAIRL
jgi:hypothetical protein